MILKVEQGKGYLNLGNTVVANGNRINVKSKVASVAFEGQKVEEMQ